MEVIRDYDRVLLIEFGRVGNQLRPPASRVRWRLTHAHTVEHTGTKRLFLSPNRTLHWVWLHIFLWRLTSTFYHILGLQLIIIFITVSFFCQSKSPKPPNLPFSIIDDKQEQLILTFRKLELANVWHMDISTKNTWWNLQPPLPPKTGI